jgi:IS5 family transposase
MRKWVGTEMLEYPRNLAQRSLSALTGPTPWVSAIGTAAAVGVAYFLAAELSLALLTKPEGVAVFWPAAGVAVGAIIALGPNARLPVAVGTIAATLVANLMGDRNLWSTILFAFCNAGEAVFAAWLIQHYFGSDFGLSRLRHVLGLLAAAIIAPALSGIGGAIAFKLFHDTATPLLTTWQHWVASDGLGILTVAPLLTQLGTVSRDRLSRSELGTAEREAALAILHSRKVGHRITLGADKAYDVTAFVEDLRDRQVTPHVAIDGRVSKHGVVRKTAVDARTTRHAGYRASQICRKRIEEIFGWVKVQAGLAKLKVRGCVKAQAVFTFAIVAYNLVRIPKLLVPIAT